MQPNHSEYRNGTKIKNIYSNEFIERIARLICEHSHDDPESPASGNVTLGMTVAESTAYLNDCNGKMILIGLTLPKWYIYRQPAIDLLLQRKLLKKIDAIMADMWGDG